MPRQNYRWLLFDADNTLFDFHASEDHLLCRTLSHFGLTPSETRKNHYRTINAALWRAFERGEIQQEELMVERYARFLREEGISGDPAAWNDYGLHCLLEYPLLLPGALEVCQTLSKQYILALVTNGLPSVQRGRLQRSPLAAYFGNRVYISGELGCRKPEKLFFDRVLTDLKALDTPRLALVIGDSLSSDIQGAQNAGLDSVWISDRDAVPGEPEPTCRVENLAALSTLLHETREIFSARSVSSTVTPF